MEAIVQSGISSPDVFKAPFSLVTLKGGLLTVFLEFYGKIVCIKMCREAVAECVK